MRRNIVVVLRSCWRIAARYREFDTAGESTERVGLVVEDVVRVVVGFDEAMSTAILSFDCRLLKDVIESSQGLCSIPEGSIFEL
jgi:hypothetical protein